MVTLHVMNWRYSHLHLINSTSLFSFDVTSYKNAPEMIIRTLDVLCDKKLRLGEQLQWVLQVQLRSLLSNEIIK